MNYINNFFPDTNYIFSFFSNEENEASLNTEIQNQSTLYLEDFVNVPKRKSLSIDQKKDLVSRLITIEKNGWVRTNIENALYRILNTEKGIELLNSLDNTRISLIEQKNAPNGGVFSPLRNTVFLSPMVIRNTDQLLDVLMFELCNASQRIDALRLIDNLTSASPIPDEEKIRSYVKNVEKLEFNSILRHNDIVKEGFVVDNWSKSFFYSSKVLGYNSDEFYEKVVKDGEHENLTRKTANNLLLNREVVQKILHS